MKMKSTLSIIVMFLMILTVKAQENLNVYYVELIKDKTIEPDPVRKIGGRSEMNDNQDRDQKVVRIYPEIIFQTMEGVGGAFNEIGGEALMSLDEEQRNELMKKLFASGDAGFSYCRTAIGSSDFGLDAYSYSEVDGDYSMRYFSIEREKTSVIPYIKLAYKYNPELFLFASPWSPPGWMKELGFMDKGTENPQKNRLKNTPEIYKAYASYFSKYVQAYSQEGINIDRIIIQNEQDITTKYPSCYMPPEEMGDFVINYLRPQFRKEGLSAEIWAGTFRTPVRLDGLEFASNKRWREAVDGLGIQYTGSEQIMNYKSVFPGIRLSHTEGVCFGGKNSVHEAFSRFEEIASYVNYGVPDFCYWNMILNETGKSGWGWKQNSLITIDRERKTITYNPDYAAMYLFGRFMRPGMKRVAAAVYNEVTITLADENKVYLFLKNDTKKIKTYKIWIKDQSLGLVDIPAHSLSVVEATY